MSQSRKELHMESLFGRSRNNVDQNNPCLHATEHLLDESTIHSHYTLRSARLFPLHLYLEGDSEQF